MSPTYGFLKTKCAKCHEPLIRITQSETEDWVICPDCHARGRYKEVIEEGAGLVANVGEISQDLADFIKKKWIARKLGRE